jgi:hypothetical protein
MNFLKSDKLDKPLYSGTKNVTLFVLSSPIAALELENDIFKPFAILFKLISMVIASAICH